MLYTMKKILILIVLAFLGLSTNAQYTNLLNFAGSSNGSNPYGDLYSDGTYLYGMTYSGGTNNFGTIFKIHPDGTGYDTLLNFTNTNGKYPDGSLISDGTYLYGMAEQGGLYNCGVIFKILPNGTGYSVLYNFGNVYTDGCEPHGALYYDGTFLYGMTRSGSPNTVGIIFKIKTDGTGYINLLAFQGYYYGADPYGSFISDGTYLYGMTDAGGTSNQGLIFKILRDGTGYDTLHNFSGTDGAYPHGSLVSDGTFLYGMTTSGGSSGHGVIFKIMPDGTQYETLPTFSSSNANGPHGSLIFDGTFLYGMATNGGANSNGVVFKILPDGSGYTDLYDFPNTTNGQYPYGSLIKNGIFLYGMTNIGGTNGDGVIFKYSLCYLTPPIISNSSDTTFCQGDSVTLTSSQAPYYLWNDANNSTTQSITVFTSNYYSVTITDSNGCTASATIDVTVNPVPTPIVSTTGNTVLCQGDSVILTSSADSAYLWNNGATTQSITVYSSGNYRVTLTDSLGCTGVSATVPVTVYPLVQAAFTTNDTIGCSPYSVHFTNASSNATNYLWEFGDLQQSLTPSPNHSYHNVGVYSVTLIVRNDTSVCPADTFTITNYITVNQSPATPVITANGPLAFCEGDSVQLAVDTSASYLWNTASTTDSITVDTSGNYSITITSGNGCTATAATNVTVYPYPVITPSGPLTFCQGDSVTLTVTQDSLYHWNTTDSTQSITVHTSGFYAVSVTTDAGCMMNTFALVTVNPLPTPSITSSLIIPFCNGQFDTLTCIPAGASYLWNTNSNTQSIIVNTAGSYVVTMTDSNGCSATTDTLQVMINPLPTPVIISDGPTSFCQGFIDTLACAPNGSSYLWNTGATTQSIAVDSTGVFFVALTDNYGCTGASAFESITVYPLPNPLITRQGDTLTVPPYSHYQWNYFANAITGDTTQSIVVTMNGCYSVMVIDSNGCTGVSDSVCFSTGINEIATNEGFSIYPNPTNGIFTIQLGIKNYESGIRIRNVLGQLIYEENIKTSSGTTTKDIDLSHEPSGIYFLELLVGDKTYNRKIVVGKM